MLRPVWSSPSSPPGWTTATQCLLAFHSSSVSLLQRVQNVAARLVFSLRPRDHVTPALIQLHWLPVHFRIQLKICTIMYRIRSGSPPQYLCDIVRSVASSSTRSGLRSSDSSDYCMPRLRTKIVERAFSYAGPRAWNSLPEYIRSAETLSLFKRNLKTFLFRTAFSLQ